jgi:glyoxylase-like metal-dependent hydrolase (beta-lactamase superfamily II)
VLIDPLPLEEDDLAGLGRPAAICLTAGSHQRAAWDLRARHGTPVWAPAGARGLEERPDALFTPGDLLPGGLRALACPGPFGPHHALLAPEAGALFVGDLLLRPDPQGSFVFPPARHMADPGRARTSARRLLTAPAQALCPGHGAPEPARARDALRAALHADRL